MPGDGDSGRASTAKRQRTNNHNLGIAASRTVPSLRNPSPPDSIDSSGSNTNQAKWFRKPSVVWFRGHDLRVEDHPALLAAAQRGGPVVPLFIWDSNDAFGRGLGDVKRWWLERSLTRLSQDLEKLGVRLHTRVGTSSLELRQFIRTTGADAVFWNRCYEPDLLQRDEEMRAELGQEGLTAESFKAELLVEPWELTNSDSCPFFKTFHDYMGAWMAFPPPPHPFPCPTRLNPLQSTEVDVGSVEEIGLDYPDALDKQLSKLWIPGSEQAKLQLEMFLQDVFPVFGESKYRRHMKGTSRLSPHIRFGELSPRRMYHATRLHVSRWHPSHGGAFGFSSLVPARVTSGAARRAIAASKSGDRSDASDSATDSSQNPNFVASRGRQSNSRNTQPKPPRSNARELTILPTPPGPVRNGSNLTSTPPNSNEPDESSEGTPDLPHISRSAKAFLKNLCLRDFSYHVLFHHPDFNSKPLVPEFVQFPWAEDADGGAFNAWKLGKTGYPIVDAAMRELRATGWIHNAMRFLLACFLTKYLLLPWTSGLKEFYLLLLDGDHSSNALGWQWTSGSNTDSFPFSCLLNPVKLAGRQDPDGDYVRRWVPELANLPIEYLHQPWKAPQRVLENAGLIYGDTYPLRIVHPGRARARAKEAMLFMKKVFASMRPTRSFSIKPVEEMIKDYPEDGGEEEGADGLKGGLFPSLWSLFEEPPVLSGDNGVGGHDFGRMTAGQDGDSGDSMEQVLLNASIPDRELLVDAIDFIGSSRGPAPGQYLRRGYTRSRRPDSRNGSGSQDAVTPTMGENQKEALPNAMKAGEVDATVGHAPPGARMVQPMDGVAPCPPSMAQRSVHPILMPMAVNQMHQQANSVVFDPMYTPGMAPVTNFPIMMGGAPPPNPNMDVTGTSNPLNVNHSADMTNRALYAHQYMYGMTPQMQMMQVHRAAGVTGVPDGEHLRAPVPATNGMAPPAAVPQPNTRQINIANHPNMAPHYGMPYGMAYGNPAFDPSAYASTMNGTEIHPQYGAVHIAPPTPNAHMLQRAAQHVVPHPVYIPPVAASASQPAPVPSSVYPIAHGSGRSVPNGTSNGMGQRVAEMGGDGEQNSGAANGKKRKSAAVEDGGSRGSPRKSRTGPSAGGRGSKSGVVTKGGVVRRSGGGKVPRSPRTGNGRSGGSKRGRGRASDGSDGASSGQMKNGREMEGMKISLEERQKMLSEVAESADHEYYPFAQFLIKTYVLTKNIDQASSKDYIRLCTLKDNYHKQCTNDKEKLKIYTIKSFFSKILRLQVTGEWDRHNHGGVRGPYVYGIRLKTNSDESGK